MTDATTLTCESQMSIRNVEQFYEQVKVARGKEKTILINMQDLTQCDTAFIQLLASLKRTLQKEDADLMIESPSEYFLGALKTLGMEQVFKLNA